MNLKAGHHKNRQSDKKAFSDKICTSKTPNMIHLVTLVLNKHLRESKNVGVLSLE